MAQLFAQLSENIFKPLAGLNKHIYEALLLHLHRNTYHLVGETPRRTDIIREIGVFLEDYEATVGEIQVEEDAPTNPDEPNDRKYAFYQRLVDTGWLIEHRDRYLRLTDFDPDAHLLLQELDRIETGETRSYGGTVLEVLTALEAAERNPQDRSESLRNAAKSAREFMQHMRTVAASMRKIEDRIISQDKLREIFRSYFEDFVQKHLIADFKVLLTKNNPFRFRSDIIRKCHDIRSDSPLVRVLGEAYHREGRAKTVSEGEASILRELQEIVIVFEHVDGQLQTIDDTNQRMEKRISNTVRYMDRVNDRRIDRVMEGLKAVSGAPLRPNDIVDVIPAILSPAIPIGPAHIPAPRPPRTEIGIQRIRENIKDPAFERKQAAKQEFLRRISVTDRNMEELLQRLLKNRSEIRATEIDISDVETFVRFQRMRELKYLFGGRFNQKYEIEILDGWYQSPWIVCPDFVIRARSGKGKKVHA